MQRNALLFCDYQSLQLSTSRVRSSGEMLVHSGFLVRPQVKQSGDWRHTQLLLVRPSSAAGAPTPGKHGVPPTPTPGKHGMPPSPTPRCTNATSTSEAWSTTGTDTKFLCHKSNNTTNKQHQGSMELQHLKQACRADVDMVAIPNHLQVCHIFKTTICLKNSICLLYRRIIFFFLQK